MRKSLKPALRSMGCLENIKPGKRDAFEYENLKMVAALLRVTRYCNITVNKDKIPHKRGQECCYNNLSVDECLHYKFCKSKFLL